ncbi:pickpocket protein 11 [Scaptodrosophila lebanonensis]|uniref:Pickpocket protein 11 n=1 Tax=Drosophila lebanonensis TaxID=7225 RepID=A0A6J2TM89_DROLE|nr:pickpocket protein 11 [Scaptodrosophila lebanonensis]
MEPQLNTDEPEQPIYLINFESYLRPKLPHKVHPLQQFVRLPKPESNLETLNKTLKRLKVVRLWRKGHSVAAKRLSLCHKWFNGLPLPSFLAFLRARVDDGLCKRKTGFEIYCEMASIHGFHIFVGAKTWQRVLWWLLICTAVLLSLIVLVMSHTLNVDTPTIRIIESMHEPTSNMPFPAVTICSLNRVSKQRLQQKARQRNESWSQLWEDLAPPLCEAQLLGCKWEGQATACEKILKPIWTVHQGLCCTFNYESTRHTFHSGCEKGLTIRLATQSEDYGSAAAATYGFEVMVHESYTTPDGVSPRVIAPNSAETYLMVKPFGTHATSYVGGLEVDKRRCYLPNERKLFHFTSYEQDNCLAECRGERLHKQCGCVAPHTPKRRDWLVCKFSELECLQKHNSINGQLTETGNIENYVYLCNCWPLCAFHRYEMLSEVVPMAVNYPVEYEYDKFFKNFNASNEVLLHVYYDALTAEQLRLDVYENWLTFIGTFGGITGLFMGCSFVSVFELIFFVFVRPTCNWLTKQQIKYRLRRKRRRQAQLAAAAH